MTAAARDIAPAFEPRRRLLLASDRGRQSNDLLRALGGIADVETISITQLPETPWPGFCGVIVDIDLRSMESVKHAKNKLSRRGYQPFPRLFVLADELHHGSMQAWALGATDTITRPFDARAILTRISAGFPKSPEATGMSDAEAVASGVAAAEGVLARIFDGLPAGRALTYRDVVQAEGPVLQAVQRTSLSHWLSAVSRNHHASYRLALFTTGYAVAFSQHLGMREEDQRRLTRAALLHDVGKAFIDERTLDAADRLAGDGLARYRQHPGLGHEALAREGGFPRELLDVVLHHHEMLDGSGYPDALQGDQISDIVRLITIFDLFASLMAPRVNHVPPTSLQAFCRLEEMGDKIDQRLLQAFRPVALSA